MRAWYVLTAATSTTDPPSEYVARAAALGCTLVVGDPTGGSVTALPSVAVTSTVLAPVVIADTAGQATVTAVTTAKGAASAAEATRVAKVAAALESLTAAVTGLAPGLAQGESDLATLAGMSTPLAPILSRAITQEMTIAQGVADLLVALELIEPTAVGG